ncbi:membrane hypothetical protein [Azospirillaceae bacterium]
MALGCYRSGVSAIKSVLGAVFFLIASLLLVAPAMAQSQPAATSQMAQAVESKSSSPMSDSAKAGAGCLAGLVGVGGAGMALGASELMMLAGGSVMVPSSGVMVMLSLFGTALVGSCSLAMTLTPVVGWSTGWF